MTIISLWNQGKSKSEISRITNHDRKTVRKVIKSYSESGRIEWPSIKRRSFLDPYKATIVEYLEEDLSGVRIHEELTKQGAKVKYRTLIEYISKIKGKRNICIRFNTQAGEEAQIDFGYVGMVPDSSGKRRKGWVFNMRLSYSRLDYYEIVFDQKVKTFIECHINAFKYFGGIPKVVKLDNLKSGIIEAQFYEPVHQELYKKFSEHYGFNPIPCRVRKPQEKGKVEAGIKYVKNNFFAGRKFSNYQDVQISLQDWLETKCNSRVHGTTKKIPRELFESKERLELRTLPVNDFIFPEIVRRKVCKDCCITVGNNYYSVPFEYVGKIVDIEQSVKLIKVSHFGKQIAMHTKGKSIGEFFINKSHYPKNKLFYPESEECRSHYKERMKAIGCHSEKMFLAILKAQPQSWYRITQGILNLTKQFANDVVEKACKRALAFNITAYSKIKNICKTGAYNLPIDNNNMEEQ